MGNDERGDRVVFVSLEHPNQEVCVGEAAVETQMNGVRVLRHPPSVKFDNGRVILYSKKDANAIKSLRAHRDYGVHIKELNEEAMKKKVEAAKITVEQVACPYCHHTFPDITDRNRHIPNCKVKNRPEVIRSDEPQSNSGASAAGRTATGEG